MPRRLQALGNLVEIDIGTLATTQTIQNEVRPVCELSHTEVENVTKMRQGLRCALMQLGLLSAHPTDLR